MLIHVCFYCLRLTQQSRQPIAMALSMVMHARSYSLSSLSIRSLARHHLSHSSGARLVRIKHGLPPNHLILLLAGWFQSSPRVSQQTRMRESDEGHEGNLQARLGLVIRPCLSVKRGRQLTALVRRKRPAGDDGRITAVN